MPLPSNPTNNQLAVSNGVTYRYNSTKGAWSRVDAAYTVAQAIATVATVDSFIGNGVQTTFTLSVIPDSENQTIVSVGGLVQPKDVYSVVAGNLTFSSPPPVGTPVEVQTFTTTVTTGYTGSSGIAGTTGFTGSIGAAGFTGSAGTNGTIGVDGYTGSIGFTGSAGAGFTGSIGAAGFTGSAGTNGTIGVDGYTGSIGFTGSAGTNGTIGVDGYTGSIGFTGSAGTNGNTGFTGSIGFTGSAGTNGNTGFTGSIGQVQYQPGTAVPYILTKVNGSQQSVATSTEVLINLNTVVSGNVELSNGTDGFSIPRTGLYDIDVDFLTNNSTHVDITEIHARIFVNGSRVHSFYESAPAFGFNKSISGSSCLYLNQNDIVKIYFWAFNDTLIVGASSCNVTLTELLPPSAGYTGSAGTNGSTGFTGSAGAGTNLSTSWSYLNTSGATTGSTGWQKVPINTISIDEATWWDNTNRYFKPTIAGWYLVSGRARTASAVISALAVGKNGTHTQAIGSDTNSGQIAIGGSQVIYLNGTTDYVDLRVFINSASVINYTTGTFDTYLQISGPLQAGPVGFTGSTGTNGFTGSVGAGFTGSAGAGFTGSSGAIGYTGSAGTGGGGGSGNSITNGTSNVTIAEANGNITASVNGTSNVLVLSNNGVSIAGTISTSGTGGNITGAYQISANIGSFSSNLISGGDLSVTGNLTLNGGVNDSTNTNFYTVGFREVPQNIQSSGYSVINSDNGKHIYYTGGAATITVPNDSGTTGGAFPIGATIIIINNGSTNLTITNGGTMYQAGTNNTGNRTLQAKGIATLIKVAADTWFITGSGLT